MHEDFSGQAARYFLEHHWFGKYSFPEMKRHLLFLLDACHAKEPDAVSKMLTLLRGFLAEEVVRKMPNGLPEKWVLQQTEYWFKNGLSQVDSAEGVFELGRIAVDYAIEKAAARLPEIQHPEKVQKLSALNEKFWQAEKEILQLLNVLKSGAARKKKLQPGWEATPPICYRLELTLLDGVQVHRPFHERTFYVDTEGFEEIAETETGRGIVRKFPFGSEENYKPWPFMPDLEAPYHFLLFDLLTSSGFVLARVLDIQTIRFSLHEERAYQMQVTV